MLEELSLEEAIELFDRQGNANKERNHDRRAIASWLKELQELKEQSKKTETLTRESAKPVNKCTLEELYKYCWNIDDCKKCIFNKDRQWGDICPVSVMRNYCKRYEIREINI